METLLILLKNPVQIILQYYSMLEGIQYTLLWKRTSKSCSTVLSSTISFLSLEAVSLKRREW